MVVCEVTATKTRFRFAAKNQACQRAFKLVTPSWRIVHEKLIRNEVTNNFSTVCHCYATAKRLHDETAAEVPIETQVTSQKYVRYRSKYVANLSLQNNKPWCTHLFKNN